MIFFDCLGIMNISFAFSTGKINLSFGFGIRKTKYPLLIMLDIRLFLLVLDFQMYSFQ